MLGLKKNFSHRFLFSFLCEFIQQVIIHCFNSQTSTSFRVVNNILKMTHWMRRTSNIILQSIKNPRLLIKNSTNTAKDHGISKKTRQLLWAAGAGVAATSFGIFIIYAGSEGDAPKKKIVVLGSGWGAVSFLKSLTPGEYDISVVSPENYFLFTPLLPSVTVGTVEGRSIIEPIRKILAKRHKHGAKFYEASCMEVDIEANKVKCRDLSGELKLF